MILFALIFSSVSFALHGATDTISGTLRKDANIFYLQQSNTGTVYRISSMSQDASEAFRNLDTGDYITGFGVLYTDLLEAHVESLDYVGLKKLLGNWYTGESFVRFATFTNLSVYPVFEGFFDLLKLFSILPNAKTDFRYSTAPYDGNRWAFFLSDSSATSLGTLEFTGDLAILRLYDSQRAGGVRTVHLVRWRE